MVFQNYQLKPNLSILELGCGNGGIWKENASQIPIGTKLTLSDFSKGMLEAAKSNTAELDFAPKYAVIDAQSIPFSDSLFDIVIANHMLYHVPDINMALKEIARVLKPGGIFYATTIGKDNFKELISLLHDFDAEIDFAQDAITKAFGLESGKDLLSPYFNAVASERYEDSLHVTESKPLIEYVLSSQGIGNINEIIVGQKIEQFKRYIEDMLMKDGYIDIQKDAGMFISRFPQKTEVFT